MSIGFLMVTRDACDFLFLPDFSELIRSLTNFILTDESSRYFFIAASKIRRHFGIEFSFNTIYQNFFHNNLQNSALIHQRMKHMHMKATKKIIWALKWKPSRKHDWLLQCGRWLERVHKAYIRILEYPTNISMSIVLLKLWLKATMVKVKSRKWAIYSWKVLFIPSVVGIANK